MLRVTADASCRRNLINNVLALLRFSRGKGIIVTSEAAKPIELRSPYDLMNLCVLFGIPFARAKFALADGCVSALLHGATRQTVKGIIKIDAMSELSPAQAAWQLPRESVAEMQRFGTKGGDTSMLVITYVPHRSPFVVNVQSTFCMRLHGCVHSGPIVCA